MNKHLFITIIMLACIFMQATAQVRRTTTARRTTTTTKAVTIPQKTTTQAKTVNNYFTIYDNTHTYSKSTFVGSKKIYYVEADNRNNAVKSIDCQTGAVETIVPGIEGIYEGARPVIGGVYEVGGYLFLILKKGGVYVWDGKSFETSKMIPNSWDIHGCNDHYVFMSFMYDKGTVKERIVFNVIDTKDWSLIYSFKYSNQWDKKVYLSSDGAAWSFHKGFFIKNSKGEDIDMIDGYGVERLKNGKYTYYNLYDLPYVSMSNDERGHYLEWGNIRQVGDSLYISVSRRIFRLDMLAANPQWEEFARLPATQPGYFGNIYLNRKGDMLTYSNKVSDADCQLWKAGHYDQPKNLGRELTTGFNEWNWRSLSLYDAPIAIDMNDNFVIHKEGAIRIWNPDGIVGYETTKGRIISTSK